MNENEYLAKEGRVRDLHREIDHLDAEISILEAREKEIKEILKKRRF